MMRWTSDLRLIRLPMIRAAMLPADFARRKSVGVFVGEHMVNVRIEKIEGVCFGGRRYWVLCPRCDRKTTVIGFEMITGVFGCRSCLKWRSRRPSVVAPHLRGPVAIGM